MKTRLVLGAMLLALLSACATSPTQQNNALQSASQAVTKAANNPDVHKYAAVDLQKARDKLGQAKKAWHDHSDKTSTDHLAYLAKRRAQIAEAMAAKGKAQAQVSQAGKKLKNLQIQELQNKLSELKPHQTDKGIVLTLGNVLFAFDSAKLNQQAQQPLDKLAGFLHEHPDDRVRIEGYTDSIGSKAYNQRLSERRAQSVAAAMTQRGVNRSHMTVTGYGEADPVASNSTASGRQQNRRVAFVILNTAHNGNNGNNRRGASRRPPPPDGPPPGHPAPPHGNPNAH